MYHTVYEGGICSFLFWFLICSQFSPVQIKCEKTPRTIRYSFSIINPCWYDVVHCAWLRAAANTLTLCIKE